MSKDIKFKQRGGNPSHQAVLKQACTLLLNNFFGKKSIFNIEIHLRTPYVLGSDNALTEFTSQEAFYSGGVYNVVIKMLRDECIEDQIMMLCHEIEHVRQIANGDLSFLKDELGNWRSYWKGVEHDLASYINRPWEIEARKHQVKHFAWLQGQKEMKECDFSVCDKSESFFLIEPETF